MRVLVLSSSRGRIGEGAHKRLGNATGQIRGFSFISLAFLCMMTVVCGRSLRRGSGGTNHHSANDNVLSAIHGNSKARERAILTSFGWQHLEFASIPRGYSSLYRSAQICLAGTDTLVCERRRRSSRSGLESILHLARRTRFISRHRLPHRRSFFPPSFRFVNGPCIAFLAGTKPHL